MKSSFTNISRQNKQLSELEFLARHQRLRTEQLFRLAAASDLWRWLRGGRLRSGDGMGFQGIDGLPESYVLKTMLLYGLRWRRSRCGDRCGRVLLFGSDDTQDDLSPTVAMPNG